MESLCVPDTHFSEFQSDVIGGLSLPQKMIPPKYFYDSRGSVLFDRICELEEYYPTRTELAIMQVHAKEIAIEIGPRKVLLELGSGSSLKTRLLLENLTDPAAYIPLDISPSAVSEAADELREQFPDLQIVPQCGDFMSTLVVPDIDGPSDGVVAYFPGSTIGNLSPDEAICLMKSVRRIPHITGFLVGVDLVKDTDVLTRAYNDTEGITAEFNLNLLHRMNDEFGADFDVEDFEHRAIFNQTHQRIEMHLVSLREQSVTIAGQTFDFLPGESICTEHSHKYTFESFSELAQAAGFHLAKKWTDSNNWFAVMSLKPF